MKGFSLITLLAILFAANFALAQDCPCDNEPLTNGLTGDDIVALLCPGGKIAEGNIWTRNPGVVAISGEIGNGTGVAYQVFTEIPSPSCEITDFVNKPVFVSLTDQEVEDCRLRLIRGCSLVFPTNIPTLSEWGMIAMAGVLGIIGLYVAARRRKATA
jgi:hypothetical protein